MAWVEFSQCSGVWWEKVHLGYSQAWKSQPCPPGEVWAAWAYLWGWILQQSCLSCSAQGPTWQVSDTQAKNFPAVYLAGVALRPASCFCEYQDVSFSSHVWNAPCATTMVLKSLCCTKEQIKCCCCSPSPSMQYCLEQYWGMCMSNCSVARHKEGCLLCHSLA